MSMTKKERAAFDSLVRQLAEARAFRFTDDVPRDLAPPSKYNELSRGWDFHLHSATVGKACSSSIYHGRSWEKTTTQNPLTMFSTEMLATRALRREMEQDFARKLAAVDLRIAELVRAAA